MQWAALLTTLPVLELEVGRCRRPAPSAASLEKLQLGLQNVLGMVCGSLTTEQQLATVVDHRDAQEHSQRLRAGCARKAGE